MRETRGSQTLGEPSQLSSKSDGAVIGTRERVDLISANKTRPQAPEAQGGRGGVRGSLSVKLPIMGSRGALGAGPAPGQGRRLLAQGPLSFSFTSTPYKYLFCCFSCCLGGFFVGAPAVFVFCPKIQTESDKVIAMPSTPDGLPEATLSPIPILLVHLLTFCFIFIPLVGVKEGPTGALSETLSRVLEGFV